MVKKNSSKSQEYENTEYRIKYIQFSENTANDKEKNFSKIFTSD